MCQLPPHVYTPHVYTASPARLPTRTMGHQMLRCTPLRQTENDNPCHEMHEVARTHIGCVGGFGMTPWCDDLVCSWRRLLCWGWGGGGGDFVPTTLRQTGGISGPVRPVRSAGRRHVPGPRPWPLPLVPRAPRPRLLTPSLCVPPTRPYASRPPSRATPSAAHRP